MQGPGRGLSVKLIETSPSPPSNALLTLPMRCFYGDFRLFSLWMAKTRKPKNKTDENEATQIMRKFLRIIWVAAWSSAGHSNIAQTVFTHNLSGRVVICWPLKYCTKSFYALFEWPRGHLLATQIMHKKFLRIIWVASWSSAGRGWYLNFLLVLFWFVFLLYIFLPHLVFWARDKRIFLSDLVFWERDKRIFLSDLVFWARDKRIFLSTLVFWERVKRFWSLSFYLFFFNHCFEKSGATGFMDLHDSLTATNSTMDGYLATQPWINVDSMSWRWINVDSKFIYRCVPVGYM